jgi:hypothetical protein
VRRRLLAVGGALAALAVLAWFVAGPPKPLPTRTGTFAFAVLGDAPYLPWEDLQYPLVMREIGATDLAFVVHVGDIFWRPCTDAHYREARAMIDAFAHPVFYTPGDNEWTDCWEDGSGSFEPLERLRSLREIFFDDPPRSLGQRTLPAVSQGGEYRENLRWEHQGVVFATVHLVGSRNALAPFPGRRKDDDAASVGRTEAAAAWAREVFAEARAVGAAAVVLAFHANPGLENGSMDSYRLAYEPFLTVLREEVERFPGHVLVVHGDEHEYIVDHPLAAKNVTRMQVPGSPLVGWVRVVVDTRARDPFSFDEHVVPRWKFF